MHATTIIHNGIIYTCVKRNIAITPKPISNQPLLIKPERTSEKKRKKKKEKAPKTPPNSLLFQFEEVDAAFVALTGVGGGIEAELLFGVGCDDENRVELVTEG